MSRYDRPFNRDALSEIHRGAQEFHEALIHGNALVICKSGSVSEDIFARIFNYMGKHSSFGEYKDRSGNQVLYLPVHLSNADLINLHTKSGLPAFNLLLAQRAATVSQWATRESHALAMRRNVPEVQGAATEEEKIIASMLNYDAQFGAADYSAQIIRRSLTRFGNSATLPDQKGEPIIVPLFNITGRIPENFEYVLGENSAHADLTHQDKTTILLVQSLVGFAYHMFQSHDLRHSTRYALAGDLKPFRLFELDDDTIEPWLGWASNDELAYTYRCMEAVEI